MQNVSSSNSQAVNVPKLRFPGFTDDWSISSFNETFCFLSNNTLSRAELTDSGEVQNIHYGDILTKFGDVVDCSKEEISFVADKSKLGSKISYLQNGDVIIADTAEDDAVGKATEILNIQVPVVSGLHTMACRPQFKFEPRYLGYYINSACYHNQLYPFMQGVKVTSVSKGNIALTEIRYPTNDEQHKIASMLALVDARIEKQRTLIESLKLYKRGALNRVFSNMEQWQKKTIKEVAKINTGSSNTQDSDPEGIYPFFIRSQNVSSSKKYLYDCEAVLTIGDGQIGKVFHYINGKFDCHQRVYMMSSFKEVIGRYFYHYFSTFFLERAMRMSAKNTVDSVRLEMISEMPIFFPSIAEQTRITKILDSVDSLIANESQTLDMLLRLKKGLLQQMFI